MGNPYRGEVMLTVNGESRVMRLSLGRLAMLEARLGDDSLVALVERFESGAFSARDLLALLAAGLGEDEARMAEAEIAGGPLEAAKAAAQLLKLTFQLPGTA